jgi:imidazolonepropionase-like amidohydrolase
MVGGGVLSETDAIESVQYSTEELRAITSVCAAMGNIPTTAHAYTDASALHAINAGVMGIEHGNLLSDSTLSL